MRRIASSLGMRRASSFFWTIRAHDDFEAALSSLAARGIEPTAGLVLAQMGPDWPELKPSDVEKHMRKRSLVQRQIMQTLREGAGPAGGAAGAVGAAGAAAGSSGGGVGAGGSGGVGVGGGGVGGNTPPSAWRGALPSSPRGAGGGMTAIEEDLSSSPHAGRPAVDAAAGVVADATASAQLAAQFEAQRAQHRSLAQAREGLVQQVSVQHFAPPHLPCTAHVPNCLAPSFAAQVEGQRAQQGR